MVVMMSLLDFLKIGTITGITVVFVLLMLKYGLNYKD